MRMRDFWIMLGVGMLLSGASCPPSPPGPAAVSGYTIVMGGAGTVGPKGVVMLSASCPTGTVATGGGFTTANSAANVFDSAPLPGGNAWSVSVKNENTFGNALTVTPIAVCVTTPGGYNVATGGITLAHQETGDAVARCPDATYRIAGGGFSTGDPAVHGFSNALGTTSQPSWIATFKSLYQILPSSSTATASIICALLPQLPGRAVVASPMASIGHGSTVDLTVDCPTGTRALSGMVLSPESAAVIFNSAPKAGGSGWTASVYNSQGLIDPITVHATLSATCVL